jgi:hypothetical protein
MNVIHTWYARVLLTLLIASQVLSMLFATVLTAAYRLHYLGVAAFLDGFTPGDDYRRFIPLMDATPWWIHGAVGRSHDVVSRVRVAATPMSVITS